MYMWEIKEGALEPVYKVRALQATGDAIDLTAATATLTMRERTTGVVKLSAVAMTLTDPGAGDLEYRWAVGDTDTPGVYDVEVSITLATGKLLRLPTGGYHTGRVVAKLS